MVRRENSGVPIIIIIAIVYTANQIKKLSEKRKLSCLFSSILHD